METESVYSAQMMDESLEYIFSSMIQQGHILDAVDFIRSVDINIIPRKTVLRTIIFEVLMKTDDIRSLALSSDYLVTILNAFPPNTEQMRTYYYDSIRDSQGYLHNLWSVFSHIVNSYFYHRSIYDIESSEGKTEPVKYPNCKFLLEFYVKLFSVDFEYLFVKSFQPCLMMQLLWHNSSICLSYRTEILLKWINDIYCDYYRVNEMGDLLGCLHEMLTLMVKCFLQAKFNLSEVAAFKHPCLSDIVEATVNFCKNAFDKPEKVKLFLASLSSLRCFQARVSERVIKQILKQGSKRSSVLTLKDIVSQYMYPLKFNRWKNVKPNMNKDKNLRKRLTEKEKKINVASSDKKMETTKIHDLVKKNKFGDLYEALHNDPEDINARDSSGSTPLHVACQEGHYLCVTVLIKESKKDFLPNLDFTATNLEGLTALHVAVKNNSIDIARELLSAGGSDLLNVKDNKGFKPREWSAGKEMETLLQKYQPDMSSNDSDSTSDSNLEKEAPNFKSFNDYSIYLHALTCLIGTYCEMFNLYEFTWKKIKVVKSHANKECCHYLEEDICTEDARIILQMPDLIAKFIESLQKNATKLQYNIDIELIPLKALAASLTAS